MAGGPAEGGIERKVSRSGDETLETRYNPDRPRVAATHARAAIPSAMVFFKFLRIEISHSERGEIHTRRAIAEMRGIARASVFHPSLESPTPQQRVFRSIRANLSRRR